MARSGNKGGQLAALCLLLAILAGAGTWNYRRNVAAEESVPRPYRSYSDGDLEVLIAAYQGEIDGLKRRHAGRGDQRVRVREGGLIDDQVREFERVQRHGRAVRALGRQIAVREASLDVLRSEQRLREQQSDRLKLLFRRVFHYSL